MYSLPLTKMVAHSYINEKERHEITFCIKNNRVLYNTCTTEYSKNTIHLFKVTKGNEDLAPNDYEFVNSSPPLSMNASEETL